MALEQTDRAASWQAAGRLDAPVGSERVVVEIRWNSPGSESRELRLELCSAYCDGSSDEVVEHVEGASPLRLHADTLPGQGVHWRVTAASTLVVRQPFSGEASFLAASPGFPGIEGDLDAPEPSTERAAASPPA
ncbi:MAG: hypothetical protein R3185_03640, partial [Candidatus Thermoplasmatota archaeon]|nr:hypothetical protein [Candidatus Thermoplasmatota archaeon]